jgi:hypothetical protein
MMARHWDVTHVRFPRMACACLAWQALGEYHRALALNPSLESAKAGLESLERLEKTDAGPDGDGDVDGV